MRLVLLHEAGALDIPLDSPQSRSIATARFSGKRTAVTQETRHA